MALALSFAASVQAQTQLAQPLESAALALPDAPEPQNSDPAAPTSSSSLQSVPASVATPPAAAPALSGDAKQQQHSESERELKQEEQQRLLGVVPNFNVVLNGQALPLTGGQKWDLALHGVVNPFYFGWAFVVGGGYSELVDSNSGYGWGPAGYFKRVGANYADNVNGALIGNALLPQLLHQDPRYFRKGTGSIKGRIWVAALSTVECKRRQREDTVQCVECAGQLHLRCDLQRVLPGRPARRRTDSGERNRGHALRRAGRPVLRVRARPDPDRLPQACEGRCCCRSGRSSCTCACGNRIPLMVPQTYFLPAEFATPMTAIILPVKPLSAR